MMISPGSAVRERKASISAKDGPVSFVGLLEERDEKMTAAERRVTANNSFLPTPLGAMVVAATYSMFARHSGVNLTASAILSKSACNESEQKKG